MHPAVRQQSDYLNEEYSRKAALDTSGPEWKDVTRQEFKAEADINVMLSRFGVMPGTKVPQYGEADFTMDLQNAFDAVDSAKGAWRKMPAHLREKYPDWRALLQAVITGELKPGFLDPEPERELEKPIDKPKA